MPPDGDVKRGGGFQFGCCPESTRVTIEVPADMVNKRLHVDGGHSLSEPDPNKPAEVVAFYATLRKYLGDVRFDRDEAHDR